MGSASLVAPPKFATILSTFDFQCYTRALLGPYENRIMLTGIEIENFFSIRSRQTVDLRVAANVPHEPGRLVAPWPGAAARVPAVIALFGANGSGKSNVLKALWFLAAFARESFHWQPNAPLYFAPFNDSESSVEPTTLRAFFSGPADLGKIGTSEDQEYCQYTYELVVSAQPPQVHREALSYRPKNSKRPLRIFDREGQLVRAQPEFGLSPYRQFIDKALRPNASLIATLAQVQHPFATILKATADSVFSNISIAKLESTDEAMIPYYQNDATLIELLNQEITRLDIGLRSVSIEQTPTGPQIQFTHEGLQSPILSFLESHGTRQFFRVFPIIALALRRGGLAVIDELDSSLHPTLLAEVISWFQDPARNPSGAQLWTTCQSASLLEELIKEEIFFCDKDRLGRTSIYGLRDVQRVRRMDNYYRKYLGGVYGAVPRVG